MNSRELADALREALREDDPPVPVRALVAAVLMCARGGAPTRLGMSKVGGYSRGSSLNHYADFIDAVVQRLPRVVASMASDVGDPVAAARLREELQQRDETIAQLRTDLVGLTDRHEELRRYALALHERLRELDTRAAAEGGRVLTLRPVTPTRPTRT